VTAPDTDAILVLNAGSSSLKLSVFTTGADELALELRGHGDPQRVVPHPDEVAERVVAALAGADEHHVTLFKD